MVLQVLNLNQKQFGDKLINIKYHLARGDNYMKWQVFDLQQNTKDYFDPDLKSIIMFDCRLGNHPATAKKI